MISNNEPRGEEQHIDQSYDTQIVVSSPSIFYNIVKVIHLDKMKGDKMFTCVTFLCLYEELLLISVFPGYLWLAMKEEGSMSGMHECSGKCFLDKRFLATTYHFYDFQSLQPLSADEVASVFYGEKG